MTPPRRALLAIATLFALTATLACGRERSYARDAIPAELATPVANAEVAMDALQQRLAARLGEALAQGGPAGAVTVCTDDAPKIASDVASEFGVAVGRTSHKLRNGANAPRPWLEPFVGAAMTEPLTGTTVVELEGKVGVVRPILTQARCLQCHGDSTAIAADVAVLLHRTYPDDRAVGFTEGQLRGFLWAEAPR